MKKRTLSQAVKNVRAKFTSFRPRVRSRHPSHRTLRDEMPLFKFKSVIRFGSQTELGDEVTLGGQRIEINTPHACATSADKLAMKNAFATNEVTTADWVAGGTAALAEQWVMEKLENGSPVVAKSRFGSRGQGNTLIQSVDEYNAWKVGKKFSKYIFEKFYNYNREYRLHVTKDGCFYTCRKVLRETTPEGQRWYRNDSNSSWLVEENESFDKPSNWATIETECVKSLKAVGLDIGACDVRVQSATHPDGKVRKDPKFIVLEINSAPSFGEITQEKYISALSTLLLYKYKNSLNK